MCGDIKVRLGEQKIGRRVLKKIKNVQAQSVKGYDTDSSWNKGHEPNVTGTIKIKKKLKFCPHRRDRDTGM